MGRLLHTLFFVVLLVAGSLFSFQGYASESDNGSDISIIQTRVGVVDVGVAPALCTLVIEQGMQISIFGSDGSLVKTYFEHNAHFRVDNSGLAAGNYTIIVTSLHLIEMKQVVF